MPRIIAIVGPTAVGKTVVSIEAAKMLGAEIVSCDSMQVYRYMPLLSQAPTAEEQEAVAHHMIDCIKPSVSFSAGFYHKLALPIIERILRQGKPVVITGGTGLYLKALMQGICDAPPEDPLVRSRLWRECEEIGANGLHDRLRSVDAQAAAKIHPNDAKRIIRALEVHTASGRPLSDWWRGTQQQPLAEDLVVVGLNRPRDLLYERINNRLLHMLYEQGVVNEVRELLRMPLSPTARQVHGLPDIENYLTGHATLKEMIPVWQQRVRNYAKRQLTWFRKTPEIRWLDIASGESAADTANRILENAWLNAHSL